MRCPATGLPDDASLCTRCLESERKRARDAMREIRQTRRAAGLCAFCPAKSDTYRCAACAIKQDRIPTVGVTGGVTHDAGDQWRRDANGWERYRGKGHPGAPSAAVNDEQDLRAAVEELERGRLALEYAHSDAVRQLGRISRKNARAAAAAILAMAARFVAEVVDRNTDET